MNEDGSYASAGALFGIVAFVIAYGYAIMAYGFLFGVGLGWLPALIVAGVAASTAVL